MSAAEGFKNGIAVLRAGYPDEVSAASAKLVVRFPNIPQIQQLRGLVTRALGESLIAFDSFRRATKLAPNDGLITHSYARASLDLGRPSVSHFEKAASLLPQDGSVLLGLAAALVAEGDYERAIGLLSRLTCQNPTWIDGYRTLAQLLAQSGLDPAGEIQIAVKKHPDVVALRTLLANVLLEAQRPEEALLLLSTDHHAEEQNLVIAAHAASEAGDLRTADELFTRSALSRGDEYVALLARHELRAKRPQIVVSLLQDRLRSARARDYYPYLSLAWRQLGDPRWEWLEGDSALVGIYDLSEKIAAIDDLANVLRALHSAKAAPLDQSVRGGTQTDGNLLLREEPEIQQLKKVLAKTVAEHIAQLPRAETDHPTLLPRRSPLNFAGSWSVRLTGSGHHADHVHTQGWLSSALYVSVPEEVSQNFAGDKVAQSPSSGCLRLGTATDLVPELPPTKTVRPQNARLVLFPSTMWHGTYPFAQGERLTVAFDVAVPKQT